jgi:hypothetical protein
VATSDEREPVGEPDPGGGGCLKLGWGCLPVIALLALLPTYIFF